jgi:large exoprotein involved in heme utilization and adhesion
LNNGAVLSANTNGGGGGSIFLNTQNLQLRHSSLFTAAAGGSGNGGNININTGTLAALENSRISADAVRGNGGNIQINTKDFPVSRQ